MNNKILSTLASPASQPAQPASPASQPAHIGQNGFDLLYIERAPPKTFGIFGTPTPQVPGAGASPAPAAMRMWTRWWTPPNLGPQPMYWPPGLRWLRGDPKYRCAKYRVSAPISGPHLQNPKMTAPPRPTGPPSLEVCGARISEKRPARSSRRLANAKGGPY